MATIDDLTPVLAPQISGTDLMYVGLPTDPDPDRTATINQMKDVFLDDRSVTNAKLRDSAALSVIGRAGGTSGTPGDIVAGSEAHVLRRSGGVVAFGQVATGGIANNAVDNTKLRDSVGLSVIGRSPNALGDPGDIVAGTDGHVLRRSGTSVGFGQIRPVGTTFMNSGTVNAGVYAGSINSDGTPLRMPSGWSVVSLDVGRWRVTHNLGLPEDGPGSTSSRQMSIVATAFSSSGTIAYAVHVAATQANYFDLHMKNTGSGGFAGFPAFFVAIRF